MNATAAGITVGGLLQSRPESLGLDLDLLAGGNGLDRRIHSPYVQKTGLALAGFHEYLRPGRMLVFGQSEVRYLETLQTADRAESIRKVEDYFVVRELLHGVLIDILGLGVLIAGESGIGKSECASKRLELVVQLERWEPHRGRNLAILVEIAARNQLLRARGHHAARKLADRLERQLQLISADEIEDPEIDDGREAGEQE